MNNIYVNTRSSIKITGSKTIYFDPLEIEGAPKDADMIFVPMNIMIISRLRISVR